MGILIEPPFFIGMCLRSILASWVFDYGIFLSSDDKFLLVLDIYYLKMTIMIGMWMMQIAALSFHYAGPQWKRLNTELLLPFMYNAGFMPSIDAVACMIACTYDDKTEKSFLKLKPSIECWQGQHLTVGVIAFIGGLLLYCGGLLYKNHQIKNILWAGGEARADIPYRYDETFSIVLCMAFYVLPGTSVMLQDSPKTAGTIFFLCYTFLFIQSYQLQPCQGCGSWANNMRFVGFSSGALAALFVVITTVFKEAGMCEGVQYLFYVFMLLFVVLGRLGWKFNDVRAQMYAIPNVGYQDLLNSEKDYVRQVATLALSFTEFQGLAGTGRMPSLCNQLHALLEKLQLHGAEFSLKAGATRGGRTDKLERVYIASAILNLSQSRDMYHSQLIEDPMLDEEQRERERSEEKEEAEEGASPFRRLQHRKQMMLQSELSVSTGRKYTREILKRTETYGRCTPVRFDLWHWQDRQCEDGQLQKVHN
jgi:hypothetical protein